LTKLFKRFDDDNDNYLDFNDFSNFMSRFEDKNLDTKELRALYEAISLKNVKGISYEAFMKYLTVKK
jgi:Ca2+-binding EF-hand superfamily protein